MTTKEILHFEVDSNLLVELGERLVAKRSIALAELIKNSYDADATKVRVVMRKIRQPGGTIVVEDNGSGMNFEEFREGWMRIATDIKAREPLSPRYKRPRTGAKGIGRFACRVLSNELELITVSQNNGNRERIIAHFDWGKFKPGKPVDEVPITVHREDVSPDVPVGTLIRLGRTRQGWTKSDVLTLQRDIFSLNSPFPEAKAEAVSSKDPGFNTELEIPEFEEYEGKLSTKFLRNAWGRLEGKVGPTGEISFALIGRGTGKTAAFQPSQFVEKSGPFTFTIHMFVYHAREFKDADITKHMAGEMGGKFGGVRIYLDGFRVFPYGEPGDDWLDIDAARGRRLTALPKELRESAEGLERPMLLIPGNNQLFGSVFLSRTTNPEIQLTVTRDKLLSNEAFAELKQVVRLGIDWLTVQYARYQAEVSTKKKRKAKRKAKPEESPTEVLGYARRQIEEQESILGPQTTSLIVEQIDVAIDTLKEREEEFITETAMLHVLASTGTIISVFNHELGALLESLRKIVAELRDLTSDLPKDKLERYKGTLDRLEDWQQVVDEQGAYLGILLGTEARTQRRSLALKQIVEELERPFSNHLREFGIEFVNEVPPTLRTPPMYSCELHSILLNLMTNSIKACKYQRSVDQPPLSRRIGVYANEIDGWLQMRFLDTGRGIPHDRWEEVFQPFVSDTEPDYILGAGTGLGLKIVRDIIRVNGGTVRITEPPNGWTTCVEIRLPTGD